MSGIESAIFGFLDSFEVNNKLDALRTQDPEVVQEYHRILGMQNEKGDQLPRLYLADEIVKLRRGIIP